MAPSLKRNLDMAKGLFTQGMCILLREPMTVGELEDCLKGFECVGHHESIDDQDGPETLILSYRPEVRGHLLVTPSNGAWPDDMGDPDEAPERFIAWSLGQFGPFAFPGCLQRAGEQSWGWEEGSDAIQEHHAHVRVLISYILGVEGDDDEPETQSILEDDDVPLVPEDYDPLDEMNFLMKAITPILEHEKAICYFNPAGEVLRDETGLRQGLNHAWNHDLPPLDMWTNVRLFQAFDSWSVMDTVGNSQFDLPDLEAVFDSDVHEPGEVEQFLRSAVLYMLNSDEDIDEGDTADGPGDVIWKAIECYEGLSDPPRPTVRWYPDDDDDLPEDLLDPGEEPPVFSEDGEFDEFGNFRYDEGLDDDLDEMGD